MGKCSGICDSRVAGVMSLPNATNLKRDLNFVMPCTICLNQLLGFVDARWIVALENRDIDRLCLSMVV